MSLTAGELSAADIAAVVGTNKNSDGFGWGGDGGLLTILLILALFGGGFGGTQEWWTDELREKYSKFNVMKSKNQRERMKTHNPMSNKDIAEKSNGQKRRKVTIGNTTYNSIKEAKSALITNQASVTR